MRTSTRILSRVVLCVAVASAVTVSALQAGAAPGRPDAARTSSRPALGRFFTVSLHFTKDRYAPHDKAHIVVTLRNNGKAELHHIGAACDRVGDPDELTNAGSNWGALAAQGPGVTLRSHQTRTFHIGARVPAVTQRAGQVVIDCDFGYVGDDNGYRPEARDTAKVPGQSGALAGDVYHYVKGQSGPTTGLADVRVVLVDPTRCPVFTRSATTDADGHFRIGYTPAGQSYELYLFPPKGWKVRDQNPTPGQVVGKDTTHVAFLTVRGSRRAPHIPSTCS